MSTPAVRRPRVLVVGPLPRAGTPIGGTQVSFAELVARLRSSAQIECEVADTTRRAAGIARWRTPQDARALAATLRDVVRRGRRCDAIVFNASSGGALRAGPLLAAAARAVGRPFALRVFGGDLDLRIRRASAVRRALFERACLGAPLVLLQTRHLCAHFARHPGVRWLPTTRDLPRAAVRGGRCARFLFLSQLRREKGLEEALAASDALPPDARMTLHGPLVAGATIPDRHPRARFAGSVEPADLAGVLARHDALVFPTWYEGEGMPGVVLEAFQAGLPVVATRWRALPELVEDGRNGLLVPVRDADALSAALVRLCADDALYQRLSRGALAAGARFRAAPWHAHLEAMLLALVDGRAVPAVEPDCAAAAEPVAAA